ncbi:MAG: peptide ABC transporter substrate-binding protein, partial [Mesorhizobium sp.]
MTRNAKSLDALRAALTPVENHLIDGYVDGRVSRREFLRHGSLLGLSLPFLGQATLSAGFSTAPSIARAEVKPGATIRVATDMPKTAIDPVQMGSAGVLLFQQVGEWLCTVGTDLALRPGLATAWKPNQDGSIWTFTLRKGVKFHSGGEMKADDVVATFNRLADPKNGSNALAVFQGVLQ